MISLTEENKLLLFIIAYYTTIIYYSFNLWYTNLSFRFCIFTCKKILKKFIDIFSNIYFIANIIRYSRESYESFIFKIILQYSKKSDYLNNERF